MKDYNITVAEAARLMGVSPQFIRVGLQKKSLPFGSAVSIKGGRYTYHISRVKFEEYMGIQSEVKEAVTVWDIEYTTDGEDRFHTLYSGTKSEAYLAWVKDFPKECFIVNATEV